jgi:hypothetical protein
MAPQKMEGKYVCQRLDIQLTGQATGLQFREKCDANPLNERIADRHSFAKFHGCGVDIEGVQCHPLEAGWCKVQVHDFKRTRNAPLRWNAARNQAYIASNRVPLVEGPHNVSTKLHNPVKMQNKHIVGKRRNGQLEPIFSTAEAAYDHIWPPSVVARRDEVGWCVWSAIRRCISDTNRCMVEGRRCLLFSHREPPRA